MSSHRQLNAAGTFMLVYPGSCPHERDSDGTRRVGAFQAAYSALIAVTAPARKQLTSRYAHKVDGMG